MSERIDYPPWWVEGAKVVARDGMTGTLVYDQQLGWVVNLPDATAPNGQKLRRRIFSPHPDWWKQPGTEVVLDDHEIRRILYDCDAAVLRALGVRVCDFDGLTLEMRTGKEQPWARPQDPLRERLSKVIEACLRSGTPSAG